MAKTKVTVLGASGMLGAMVLDVLAKEPGFELTATLRSSKETTTLQRQYPKVKFRKLDAEAASVKTIQSVIKGARWVVNAIGIIKPYIHDDNAAEVERALRVNALFPHLLAQATAKGGVKVIQIATDCVYSGSSGKYLESAAHDALDVYGKSKSLGEVYAPHVYHLRCSIIGPERKAHLSLMDWFLGQPAQAESNGFTNHQWNGVTTLQFGRLCAGIIKHRLTVDHIQHIVPGNLISKANLLKCFAKEFGRDDIKVNPVKAPTIIDRTLATEKKALNSRIWRAAGYSRPPTIENMVAELAAYQREQT